MNKLTDNSQPSHALGVAGAVTLVAFLAWGGAVVGGVAVSRSWTPRPEIAVHPVLAKKPALPRIELSLAMKGREVFEQTCRSCHASSGLGMPGLGKDLVRSDYVAKRDDASLVAFVVKGREVTDPLNTTKVAMPPKGGNANLSDAEIGAAIAYVRGLQDPRRMPELPAYVAPPVVVTEAEKAQALAAAGGDAELAAYIASGTKIFNSTCIACHGPGGVGIKGNGKALAENEFVASKNDDDLLAFIKRGRVPGEPLNTTGVAMPPRGGNPALSDDDLLDVISYVRTLQAPKASTMQK